MIRHILLQFVMLSVVGLMPISSMADATGNSAYRRDLMEVFQLHLTLMENILSGKTTHWDNIFRHAIALQKDGEFLDHGFLDETEKPVKDNVENSSEKEKSFFHYVHDSVDARYNLVEVVGENYRNKNDTRKISEALEQVKASCEKCHQKFRPKK